MQNLVSYKIEKLFAENPERRGVVFIISEDRRVTAKDRFDTLREETQDIFKARFDQWVIFKPNDKWYHGWSRSQFEGKYSKCYVFKCKERRLQQRLYGFLCNPKKSNPRYQVCVLVSHALKNEHETDVANLNDVEAIRTTFAVQKSIDIFFRE